MIRLTALKPMSDLARIACLVSLVYCAAILPANAEETKTGITVELNLAEDVGDACQMTFVATNMFEADIEQLGFQTVLFDGAGLVDQITAFSFGAMPAGKTLVRQFAIANKSCGDLGRVLINSVIACDGEGLTPEICQASLTPSTRADIAFGL